MQTIHILYVAAIAVMSLGGFATPSSADQPTPGDVVTDSDTVHPTPRELHRYLAEGKARALDRTWKMAAVYGRAPLAQEDMDALYYKIELRIDEVTEMVYGRVTMTARALVDGFSQAVLDLQEDMDVDSVFDQGAYTTTWSHADNFLTIDLAATYDTDEQFEVTVVYHGHPVEGGLQGFSFAAHSGTPLISTLSCPYQARTWWPCKDVNYDKADSVDIIVEVNADFFVSSNGTLRDSVNHGATTTYWWHEQYPIAPYLVCLTATNFDHIRRWYTYGPADTDSMPVDFYCYPELHDDVATHWPEIIDVIEFYADTFGEYPFIEEKYAMTHFNWGGGMEHQTNSSITSSAFGFDRYLIAHELSHMWWGDNITCKTWHHCWLNEGFASYCEALYAEHLGGSPALQNYMSYFEYFAEGAVYIYDTSSVSNIFSTRAYDKGAWVVHMLRGMLGDSVFFAGLKQYAVAPQFIYGSVTTEEFRDFFETIGGFDLDFFFEQWIYDEYYPIYEYGFLQDPVTHEVRFYITQTQQDLEYRPLFEMPIRFRFDYTGGGDTTVTVWNNQTDQAFTVELDGPVETMVFDPAGWILKRSSQSDGLNIMPVGFAVDDSQGDGNGRPDPGETNVELVIYLDNLGADALGLTMHAAASHPEIIITNGQSSFGDALHGQQVDNATEPIVFSVDADFPPTIVDFILTFSAYGGVYTFIETLKVDIGPLQVIIVDDDLAHPLDYESYYTAGFTAVRVPHVVWDKDALSSPPADTLTTYPVVVWFTGNARSEVLAAEDVANLRDFLDGGGRLLMTGQDIAEDLANDADSTFLTDYLHVRFVSGIPLIMVEGVPGDPIGDGQLLPLGGPGGAANQNSPDIIEPLDGHARPVYTYYNSSNTGGVRVIADGYRVVFLGFGCEAIADGLPGYTKRDEVFARVFAWLMHSETEYVPGDLNGDDIVDPVDVTWMVDYVYRSSGTPMVLNAMDVNADCWIDPLDVAFLVCFVYQGLGNLQPGCVE